MIPVEFVVQELDVEQEFDAEQELDVVVLLEADPGPEIFSYVKVKIT
jgi:hypothetical protein